MWADKELLESRSLGRRLYPEPFANVCAVLVVIGNSQPLAFFIRAGLQRHAGTAQHQRIFQLQRRFQHVVRVDQHRVARPATAGGYVVFGVTVRAVFKTETEITLFAMPFIVFKPALTAAAKVFNQRTVGGGFAPEGVSKPAGGTKHLNGDVVTFAFRRANFRRVEIVRVTRVIQNQAVRFPWSQPQAAPDNLLIKADGFGWAQNSNQVDVRGVKAGG